MFALTRFYFPIYCAIQALGIGIFHLTGDYFSPVNMIIFTGMWFTSWHCIFLIYGMEKRIIIPENVPNEKVKFMKKLIIAMLMSFIAIMALTWSFLWL